jgi:hypothetical protein
MNPIIANKKILLATVIIVFVLFVALLSQKMVVARLDRNQIDNRDAREANYRKTKERLSMVYH